MFAVTWSVWQQLQRFYPRLAFHLVTPPLDHLAMIHSRLCRRILGRPGCFFSFSERTLKATAARVMDCVTPQHNCLIFRSSTRWSRCRPQMPYFVHLDAVFHTYFRNTFAPEEFLQSDLNRIYEAETEFLEQAAGVFFESAWGLAEARKHYRLRGDHYQVTGVAGYVAPLEVPPNNVPELVLVTIAKNFHQKGGDIVEQAYRLLLDKSPNIRWHIIGGPPDLTAMDLPGVHYEGYLQPDNPLDLERLKSLLSTAAFIVHPSREDMNPLVLLEAAGYGCPAVTVHDFAIHELVDHGVTGWLLPRPVTPTAVSDILLRLWSDQQHYREMRSAAWNRARRMPTWDRIGDCLHEHIEAVLR